MAKNKDFFTAHSRLVEKFIAGTRTNPSLCTTENIAKRLEKAYNVEMKKKEIVDLPHGLYMFEIIKKH